MSTKGDTQLPEWVFAGNCASQSGSPRGVTLRAFASEECGAKGFSTGTATFQPSAKLAYHEHSCSEAITILEGVATVLVEGRCYRLFPLDSIHVPSSVAHSVCNADTQKNLIAHCAFGASKPTRDFVEQNFPMRDCGIGQPAAGDPETINRSGNRQIYELSPGALFSDLFAGRFGSQGICGGYGKFAPGSSLPCHVHEYDESITIVEGRAVCFVEGRRYTLSGLDTAFVPQGRPHRFFNDSDAPMAMLWVYAGDEPGRTLVDSEYCAGSLVWPSAAKRTEG